MADKNLRARVTGLASQAVSNPVSKAAFGAAKGVTGAVTGAAMSALRSRGGDQEQGGQSDQSADSPSGADLSTAQPAGAPAEDTVDSASPAQEENTAAPSGGTAADTESGADTQTGGDTGTGADAGTETETGADTGAGAAGAPQVDLLPYPDLEEPIPIVEQTLADEAENGAPVGGHATEPHASTRDEGHGDAQLQPAEQAEIAEEVAEAMPGGDLDLETPVGTTGADVGWNPDTAEADLQQPQTAPGIDPGLTSSVRKDQERGLSAAQGPDEVR